MQYNPAAAATAPYKAILHEAMLEAKEGFTATVKFRLSQFAATQQKQVQEVKADFDAQVEMAKPFIQTLVQKLGATNSGEEAYNAIAVQVRHRTGLKPGSRIAETITQDYVAAISNAIAKRDADFAGMQATGKGQ